MITTTTIINGCNSDCVCVVDLISGVYVGCVDNSMIQNLCSNSLLLSLHIIHHRRLWLLLLFLSGVWLRRHVCVCVYFVCFCVVSFRLCVFCRWIKMGFNFIVNNLLSHTHFNSHSAHHPVESLYVDTYQSITLKTDNTIFNSQTHSLTHTQTNKTHSSFPPIHFHDSIIFLLDFFQYHSLFFSLYRLIVAWLIGWLVGWLQLFRCFIIQNRYQKFSDLINTNEKKTRDVNHWLPSFAHFFATDCFFFSACCCHWW